MSGAFRKRAEDHASPQLRSARRSRTEMVRRQLPDAKGYLDVKGYPGGVEALVSS